MFRIEAVCWVSCFKEVIAELGRPFPKEGEQYVRCRGEVMVLSRDKSVELETWVEVLWVARCGRFGSLIEGVRGVVF